jgi:asparagine synthase (glutamine-hydrolysing)
MSGIAAFFRLDGAEVPADLATDAVETLRWRGDREQAQVHRDGPITLVHVPASFAGFEGAQPAVSKESGWSVVLDGRLDHRGDLARDLDVDPSMLDDFSDADLVLRAVEHLGDGAAGRLEGDFAFLAWNTRQRRLLAGRDALGLRPLFHARVGDLLVLGSDPRLAHGPAGLPRRVNEGVFAEMLAGWLMTLEETAWEGVHRLPPGGRLLARDGRVETAQAWELDPSITMEEKTAEEHSEVLRGILDAAVRSRLRSGGPVGLQVSGGMDSTAVAATAARLHRFGDSPCPSLFAYGLGFPGLPCDETRRIREVLDHLGLPGALVDHEPAGIDDLLAHRPLSHSPPPNPCFLAWSALERRADADGVRVLLGGFGGDEWLDGNAYAVADRVRDRGWIRTWREELRGTGRVRKSLSHLFRYGAGPRLPATWIERVDSVRGRPPVPSWIDAGFAARVDLADRLRQRIPWDLHASHAQAAAWANTRTGFWSETWEEMDREAHLGGVEHRQPLLDRRVVSFGLALPPEVHREGGTTKRVLRLAVENLLPEHIRETVSKPAHTPVVAEALRTLATTDPWTGLALVEDGLVDGDQVRELVSRLAEGKGATVSALWNLLAMERWWQGASRTDMESPNRYAGSSIRR